ncbi:hypothetical protein Dip518_000029 [Parelusimicrobium proximum]|uniref:hypothetical protein n=1 Tax=Parelusimicrobium proximum TaxID=3228953 RepID=UPI003D18745F
MKKVNTSAEKADYTMLEPAWLAKLFLAVFFVCAAGIFTINFFIKYLNTPYEAREIPSQTFYWEHK